MALAKTCAKKRRLPNNYKSLDRPRSDGTRPLGTPRMRRRTDHVLGELGVLDLELRWGQESVWAHGW